MITWGQRVRRWLWNSISLLNSIWQSLHVLFFLQVVRWLFNSSYFNSSIVPKSAVCSPLWQFDPSQQWCISKVSSSFLLTVRFLPLVSTNSGFCIQLGQPRRKSDSLSSSARSYNLSKFSSSLSSCLHFLQITASQLIQYLNSSGICLHTVHLTMQDIGSISELHEGSGMKCT